MGQARLGRMSVDYTKIWEEVTSSEFKGAEASTEHNRASIDRLRDLIQDAVQLLRSPNVSKEQSRRVKVKIRQMMSRLSRERVLAKRVDPSIP